MKDDDLINHAACALQESYEYLDSISFYDSDLEQVKVKIMECYDALNLRGEEEE